MNLRKNCREAGDHVYRALFLCIFMQMGAKEWIGNWYEKMGLRRDCFFYFNGEMKSQPIYYANESSQRGGRKSLIQDKDGRELKERYP